MPHDFPHEKREYRWWLIDGDLALVADGRIFGPSLGAALASLDDELDHLGDQGLAPVNHPYRLLVYKGDAVVAVRPRSVGIC